MEPLKIKPVKLIIAALTGQGTDSAALRSELEAVFSPVDFQSPPFPFDMTDYYRDEMGPGLQRVIFSFTDLIRPASIAEIKRLANCMENRHRQNGGRRINLDPGYLDADKMVLASAKYGRQKIALDNGIYADPVLEYTKKQFRAFAWTFPDFKSGRYDESLGIIRRIYLRQLRS